MLITAAAVTPLAAAVMPLVAAVTPFAVFLADGGPLRRTFYIVVVAVSHGDDSKHDDGVLVTAGPLAEA